MGEARAKKLAGVPPSEQPKKRTPRVRRTGTLQFRVNYTPKLGKHNELLGPNPRSFIVHRDGSVYETKVGEASKQTVKVIDERIIRLIRSSLKPRKES